MDRPTTLSDARLRTAAVVAVVLALVVGLVVVVGGGGDGEAAPPTSEPDPRQIVVGEVTIPQGSSADEDLAAQGPGVDAEVVGGRLQARPEPAPSPVVAPPDGAPPPPPIPFRSDSSGVDGLVFVVVAGSDARPGEDVTRTRADSVHLVAIDPARGAGTIVGIPRDSWVEIPGHGRGKINSALAIGGPDLLADTVAQLTGAPIRYYALTGFDGFARLVDDLGGVDVHLDRRMDDRFSGARFERGWHRFTGPEALAYTRNRKDVAFGDFSRSENHGILMLSTLAKMRAEIGDDGGIERWLDALRRHVRLDVGMDDLFRLAVTARRTDPRRMANIVATGTVGRAEGQSVVFLDDEARATFADVADDGVLANPPPPYAPPGYDPDGSGTTTTTTAGPTAPTSPDPGDDEVVPPSEPPPPTSASTTSTTAPPSTLPFDPLG